MTSKTSVPNFLAVALEIVVDDLFIFCLTEK